MSNDKKNSPQERTHKAQREHAAKAAPDEDSSLLRVVDPWSQRGVYIRLSKQRKTTLLKIAAAAGNASNPHQALAACIDSASLALDAKQLRDDTKTQMLSAEFDENADGLASRLDSMQKSFDKLELAFDEKLNLLQAALAPLANVSVETNFHHKTGYEATPLKSWLSSVPTQAYAHHDMLLVEGCWSGTLPSPNGTLTVMLDVRLISTCSGDGGANARVEISGVSTAEDWAINIAKSPGAIIVMACQESQMSGDWIVSFFPRIGHDLLGECTGSIHLVSDRFAPSGK